MHSEPRSFTQEEFMLKLHDLDYGEEIKSEIGTQVIFILLLVFIALAIFSSDAQPVVNDLYAMPAITLGIVGIVILTLALFSRGYAVYRWAPFLGLVLLPPALFYTYQEPGVLVLLLVAALITPILINDLAGVLLAAFETVLILLTRNILPLTADQVFYSILGLWVVLGISILTLRNLFETIAELNKKYNENAVLLESAREAQGQLNGLIKERTEANIQLARLNNLANHLRQIAEDERKTKEEFVAKVSHELRTPLNMIIGFCTVLMESSENRIKRLPQSIQADLEVILRNSQHLSQLINDILDLSQINAGQMAIVKDETDIPGLIEEAVVSVRPLFESKNIYLRTEVDTPLPQVWCDRTRLVEVLLNLLSNAGRYTHEGGVTVRARPVDHSVEIQVTDTGIGIPRQKQERLFDPFYQIDGGIRRKYGGTGLGLSISKHIVELHGGRMWVESEEGKGTTFLLHLPVQERVMDSKSARRWFNPHQPEIEQPAHAIDSQQKIEPRIVTVDPDGDLTRILRRYMGRGEYIPTPDLAAAIAELDRTPAQLLLINTERISDDLDQLRVAEALPYSTPAILCSIPTSRKTRAQWDIFDILVKPIREDDLADSLTRLGPDVKTVLVVDDDPDNRRLMKRMLRQKKPGMDVLMASSGVHALQVLKRQSVDVILLDLIMPTMDGFQFLEAKKEQPGCQDVPVILISAYMLQQRPAVSDGLGVVMRGGLSLQQFLRCIDTLTNVLGPE
jgi:signal transduction histidine kinase/CheY-like chemotaxis protein